jgi:hypothetical protein
MPKSIPLTQGKVAIVDDADYLWLSHWKWHVVTGRGKDYAARSEGARKNIRMHREIMGTPAGVEVDHVNNNGLDNRRMNLRKATREQNRWNRGKTIRNHSGYKGVNWNRGAQKYRAQITVGRKQIHLGCFDDPVEAARAYDASAREFHGEFARTNF